MKSGNVTQGDRQRHEIYYSGTVQGVGFRYTVRALARGFAVGGYVRNLPDGRVQLVAEGSAEEIVRFIEAIRGELGHYIRQVDATRGASEGKYRDFEIRY